MELTVQRYEASYEKKWDDFVMKCAYNGTFQQTRNFLNYHPEGRFVDASLVIWKGASDILAVIPAVEQQIERNRLFISHPGATFGGITFNKAFYNTEHMERLFDVLEKYLKTEKYSLAILKQPSSIFSKYRNDLLEYFFFQKGWSNSKEISFVIDFDNYDPDIISNYSSSKRRDYRYSEKNDLYFRELSSRAEIALFHDCLVETLLKHNTLPVHSYAELLDFKENRLSDIVSFYGVFHGDKMVAASMVFRFKRDVFHTQYLAAKQDALDLFPNNYLDTKLIEIAREEGFKWFSFGISTEDHGRVLNNRLARFKEGFGTTYCNNQIFSKQIG